ncbi:MAG: hypothetical protein KC438_04035, partial [Thermomicrobiales bacterium]|nr:hypothetical protein [Thermomicrobiales bacterium]
AVGTTNAQGQLVFSDLAVGAYNLDETTGDWCHAEADRVDSAGNVLVAESGNNDVFIYNCSLQSVADLPSTGTGAQAGATPARFGEERIWQLVLAAMATLGIALLLRHRLEREAAQVVSRTEASSPAVAGDDTPPAISN